MHTEWFAVGQFWCWLHPTGRSTACQALQGLSARQGLGQRFRVAWMRLATPKRPALSIIKQWLADGSRWSMMVDDCWLMMIGDRSCLVAQTASICCGLTHGWNGQAGWWSNHGGVKGSHFAAHRAGYGLQTKPTACCKCCSFCCPFADIQVQISVHASRWCTQAC